MWLRAALNLLQHVRQAHFQSAPRNGLQKFSKCLSTTTILTAQRESRVSKAAALAPVLWCELGLPVARRSSSSEGSTSSIFFPSLLAALTACSIPSCVKAESGDDELNETSRKKLAQLLEGLQGDPQRKAIFGPGSSLWLPASNIRLARVLDEGSFGKIWVGELQDNSGTQEVAVKLLSENMLRHQSLAELLRCEAEVFQRVSTRCHHVCRLYGITWKGDHLCLIMKLYKKSLGQLIQEHGGRLPMMEIKKYVTQVCKGLVELHDQGVIMQDLKPANVLIDDLDHAVLADFGMASFVDRNKGSRVVTPAKGTPSYMAPEAWDPSAKGGMSTKTDIWSLGCMIIELFTGTPPWQGMEITAISTKVKDDREVPTIPSGIPASLDRLLQRCFSYDEKLRPEAREVLEVFMEEWTMVEKVPAEGMGFAISDEDKNPNPVFRAPIEQSSFYSFAPFPLTEQDQQPIMKSLYEVDKDLFHAVDRLSHLMEAI